MSGGSYNYIYNTLSEECEGYMHDEEMNALIKDLCKVLHDLEWWQSCDISEENYRKTVTEFKEKWFHSTENKGEWIPVTERLPEKDMACLVAVGLLNLTQFAIYSDLMGVIDHRIFYQGDVGHDSFENITEYVKAWQPLPEPYKAESEEK